MKHLTFAIALGFALIGCQAVKEKDKNESKDDSSASDSSLEDKYQSALLSESSEAKEKSPDDGDEEKKPKKGGLNIGALIMSLFDTDGDSMLTEKELNVMIKLTKNMLGKFIGGGMKPGMGDMGHHGHYDHDGDKHRGPGLDKIFDCMDGNKDGSLSKEEFISAKKEFGKECFRPEHEDEEKMPVSDEDASEKEDEKEDEKDEKE